MEKLFELFTKCERVTKKEVQEFGILDDELQSLIEKGTIICRDEEYHLYSKDFLDYCCEVFGTSKNEAWTGFNHILKVRPQFSTARRFSAVHFLMNDRFSLKEFRIKIDYVPLDEQERKRKLIYNYYIETIFGMMLPKDYTEGSIKFPNSLDVESFQDIFKINGVEMDNIDLAFIEVVKTAYEKLESKTINKIAETIAAKMEVKREKEVISKICDQLSFITKRLFNNPVLKGLNQLLKAYMDSNYIQLAEDGKESSYLDAIKNKHYVRAWQLLNEIEYPDSYELLMKSILLNIFKKKRYPINYKDQQKKEGYVKPTYFSDKKIPSNQNEIADAIIEYSRNFPLFFSALSIDCIEALVEHPCFVVSGMDNSQKDLTADAHNIKAKLSSSQEYTQSTEKVRIFVARDYYLMTNIPCVIIHQASDSKKYSATKLDRIKESADRYYTIYDYPEAIKRYTKYLCNASYIDMEVLLHMAHAFYCQNDFHLAIGCMEYLYYSDTSLLLSEDDEDMYYELCYKRAKKIVYRYFLDNGSGQSINIAAFNCADVRLAELYIAFIEHFKEINKDYAKILFESLLNIGPFPADSFISDQINDLANALGIEISPQTAKNLYLESCLITKSPLE